jgi:hypothetical protein
MQGHNFIMVASRKRLGKTHLHVSIPKNVNCGYFWVNWILGTSGNHTHEILIFQLAEILVLTFLPKSHSSQTRQQTFPPTAALCDHQ